MYFGVRACIDIITQPYYEVHATMPTVREPWLRTQDSSVSPSRINDPMPAARQMVNSVVTMRQGWSSSCTSGLADIESFFEPKLVTLRVWILDVLSAVAARAHHN